MMHLLGLLLAAAHRAPIADPGTICPDDADDGDLPWSFPGVNDYRQMPPEPDYLTVACPRCRAAVGEKCYRRSLGRHSEHRARVEAAYAVRRGER